MTHCLGGLPAGSAMLLKPLGNLLST